MPGAVSASVNITSRHAATMVPAKIVRKFLDGVVAWRKSSQPAEIPRRERSQNQSGRRRRAILPLARARTCAGSGVPVERHNATVRRKPAITRRHRAQSRQWASIARRSRSVISQSM
jgi:hypothetical protein